jgi:L-2-hydroxycarboxylate dehydrogenase (NAD+)
LYVEKIQKGHMNPKDEVTTVVDSDAVAILDANGCFGQVAAKVAVEIAIKKAEKYGIATVGVRNSNNFGTAGYYGDYVARRGMVAFVFTNAAPAIAPTGGNKTIFGTNPICFAFPGSDVNNPIVLDMATTVVARSKIRQAARSGEKIPSDWAIGPDGRATDDPNEALKGSLLPIAGYKGYGLSLFVDVFAGMLTGSAYAGEVKPLSNMDYNSNNGHLFVVIDTSRFMNKNELNERVNHFYEAVKSCGTEESVMLPGEPGYKKMAVQTEMVTISENQFKSVNETAESIGISARLEKVED